MKQVEFNQTEYIAVNEKGQVVVKTKTLFDLQEALEEEGYSYGIFTVYEARPVKVIWNP